MEKAMTENIRDAIAGQDVRVDYNAIEQTLSELWRVEKNEGEAITRAALWNVVAHASSAEHHTNASEVLGRAAISVPQRTIVIRTNPGGPSEMAAWISANCHLLGAGRQVCCEEISIVAGGDRVQRVAPLVHALLIPDMPVAFWWVGDLPHENAEYVQSLLGPADRLIVDSVHFDNPADLMIVERVGESTHTAPADLNWVRLDEWRAATASVFDPPEMRGRLKTLREIRIVADVTDVSYFGESVQGLYFAAWLIAQAGMGVDDSGNVPDLSCSFEFRPAETRGLMRVDLEMDGSSATIERDRDRSVLTTNVDGHVNVPEALTRTSQKKLDELIVRELKQPESDRLLLKALPFAIRIAQRRSAS
jgi:glucose-6-phosphate dehydrogenase assembly protein OpcA